jgi:hypothetical protein
MDGRLQPKYIELHKENEKQSMNGEWLCICKPSRPMSQHAIPVESPPVPYEKRREAEVEYFECFLPNKKLKCPMKQKGLVPKALKATY